MWSTLRFVRIVSLFIFILTGVFFYGANDTQAEIKILSNSRHAYSTINSTINLLLGTGHVGTDIIVHSTNLIGNGGYTACCSSVFNASATYYDHLGVAVPSQAPYQLYTSSFAVNAGDTVSQYNQYNEVDFTHNLALTTSPNFAPPVFYTAPGGGGWASKPGVEWSINPSIFCVSTLSCLTAANAGIMASVRYNHPTWNWLDVKAALRQTGANWATGYNSATYGFGIVNYASSTALADNEILLQPPVASTTISGFGQVTFTLYPFKQTRRVKEVLFQFASNPGFQADELTLSDIASLGGTKITEYTNTSATSTFRPISTPLSNAYFVWLTADNADDNVANFSRIDTYTIRGPISQNEIPFTSTFDLLAPANNEAVSVLPTFTWTEPTSYLGIAKYELYIDGALVVDDIAGTSTTISTPLSEGSHTWYIKAVNGGNTSTTSISTRTFQALSGYTETQAWYVDNVLGDDNNPGTEGAPWATISKAASTAQPGNTVIIIKNEGVPYREQVTTNSGNLIEGNITFRGVSASSKPEIWGSNDVSETTTPGWSLYGGGNADTYQKSVVSSVDVLGAGISANIISQRVWADDANVLNEGEWFYDTNTSTLYYRLNPGEDINSLNIEAGTRDYGIFGGARVTLKNIVVRYVNNTGISLSTGSIGEGLEVYDSGLYGVVMSGNGSAENLGPILRYSVISGSYGSGIYVQFTTYARVYNNIVSNNGKGLEAWLWAHNSVVRNNIFINNTNNVKFTIFAALSDFTASHNNWYDGTVDSHWTNTYKGTNNLESVDPLLTNVTARDFRLQKASPNIDSGISISGLTTDVLGNQIYGTPDIGPYEYQPPYSISVTGVPTTGSIRLYADGRYRELLATTSASSSPLNIAPEGGWPNGDYRHYVDVAISTWDDTTRTWTASSSIAANTVFTIAGLNPSRKYIVSVDNTPGNSLAGDCGDGECVPDRNGNLAITYVGTWSEHTFTVTDGGSASDGSSSTRTNKTITQLDSPTTSHSALLTRIAELKALIATLTAKLNHTDSYQFTRELKVGDDNEDVLHLQQFLNTQGFPIASTGPGSPGNETMYFGSMTRAALALFQEANRDTILTPIGLSQPTGYFGPATMKVINDMSGN